MLLAAENNYPLLEVIWTIIVFFSWVIWIWIVISILSDLFRRHDIGGGSKALWVIGVILLPFLGVLIYLISQGQGMAERNVERMQASQQMWSSTSARLRAAAAAARRARSPAPRRCSRAATSPRRSSSAQAQGARLSASTYRRVGLGGRFHLGNTKLAFLRNN